MKTFALLCGLAAFNLNGMSDDAPTRAEGGGPAFGGVRAQTYDTRAHGGGTPFGGLLYYGYDSSRHSSTGDCK